MLNVQVNLMIFVFNHVHYFIEIHKTLLSALFMLFIYRCLS